MTYKEVNVPPLLDMMAVQEKPSVSNYTKLPEESEKSGQHINQDIQNMGMNNNNNNLYNLEKSHIDDKLMLMMDAEEWCNGLEQGINN